MKNCKDCALEIPCSAKKCTHCGEWQSIQFWKTVRSVGTVIGIWLGVLAFIISNWEALMKSISGGDSVAVFSISPLNDSYVVGNTGDWPIYFSHILLDKKVPRVPVTDGGPGGRLRLTNSISIKKKIAPGDVVMIAPDDDEAESLREWQKRKKEEGYTLDDVIVSPYVNADLILGESHEYNREPCIYLNYAMSDEPSYSTLIRHYTERNKAYSRNYRMVFYEIEGEAHFYSLKDGEFKSQPLEVIGYLSKLVGKECPA